MPVILLRDTFNEPIWVISVICFTLTDLTNNEEDMQVQIKKLRTVRVSLVE